MKSPWIIACSLAFVSAAGFAQAPSEAAALHLAAILGGPAFSSSCATPQSGVLFAAKGPRPSSACNAMATCASGSVSCSGNNICAAWDRSCPEEQGHVTCDGVTTWCPTTCCGPGGGALCLACCNNPDDCFACCRCGGGTGAQCAAACS